jgi:programmed cell death protein 4
MYTDGRPVEEMKIAIDQLLQEYLLSSDLEEATRCIKELNAPLFSHEVYYTILYYTFRT